jgi:hypothetical protein
MHLATLVLTVTPYVPAAIEETTALGVRVQEAEALAVEVADVEDERASTSL